MLAVYRSLHKTKSVSMCLEERPHILYTNTCVIHLEHNGERVHLMARRYEYCCCCLPYTTPRAATSVITSHLPSGMGAFRRQDHTPTAPSAAPAVATPKDGKRLFAARPGWLILQTPFLDELSRLPPSLHLSGSSNVPGLAFDYLVRLGIRGRNATQSALSWQPTSLLVFRLGSKVSDEVEGASGYV